MFTHHYYQILWISILLLLVHCSIEHRKCLIVVMRVYWNCVINCQSNNIYKAKYFKRHLSLIIPAVTQPYNTEAHNEYVVLGNDAILKCSIPSFVADFISVIGWVDNESNNFQRYDNNGNEWLYCNCSWRKCCTTFPIFRTISHGANMLSWLCFSLVKEFLNNIQV